MRLGSTQRSRVRLACPLCWSATSSAAAEPQSLEGLSRYVEDLDTFTRVLKLAYAQAIQKENEHHLQVRKQWRIRDKLLRFGDLLVGRGRDFFQDACARHADHCEVAASRQYNLVVASCGGFPKDINFIQSHKAIHHAADFVRDGGRLIVLAQCGDGIGSQTFLPWFEIGSWDKAFDRLAADYVGNGGTALA